MPPHMGVNPTSYERGVIIGRFLCLFLHSQMNDNRFNEEFILLVLCLKDFSKLFLRLENGNMYFFYHINIV